MLQTKDERLEVDKTIISSVADHLTIEQTGWTAF
jgi:hypothetical protein